jgi:protein SCO1/2
LKVQIRESEAKRQQIGDRRFGGAMLLPALLIIACLSSAQVAFAQYGTGPLEMRRQDQQQSNVVPAALQNIGIDQRLNERLPLDATFRDEAGNEVRLGDYFKSGRPVVLSLVYYDCPMLCTQVLNGEVESFRALPFTLGKDFEAVSVSFDPREKPQLAADKKQVYALDYKRPGVAEGWHFLTGDQDSIKRLTEAVGFRYSYDEQTKQFVHASAIYVATPDGHLSRYFYGVAYPSKQMRLSLIEAAAGKIGSPINQLLFYCYHYDPTTGKYGMAVLNVMRAGGVLTMLAIISLIVLLRRRKTAGEHLEEARGAV